MKQIFVFLLLFSMTQPGTSLANNLLLNALDWKVGDSVEYNVLAGDYGFVGKMTKSVTKDEGTALWISQITSLMVKKEREEALIDKTDGKVLKLFINGKEQPLSVEDPIEIISQEGEDITVPAGAFPSIHIVARTKDIERIEYWINARDTAMDGILRKIIVLPDLTWTYELVRFKKMP